MIDTIINNTNNTVSASFYRTDSPTQPTVDMVTILISAGSNVDVIPTGGTGDYLYISVDSNWIIIDPNGKIVNYKANNLKFTITDKIVTVTSSPSNKWIIVIIVLILLAIGAGIIFAFYRKKSISNDDPIPLFFINT